MQNHNIVYSITADATVFVMDFVTFGPCDVICFTDDVTKPYAKQQHFVYSKNAIVMDSVIGFSSDVIRALKTHHNTKNKLIVIWLKLFHLLVLFIFQHFCTINLTHGNLKRFKRYVIRNKLNRIEVNKINGTTNWHIKLLTCISVRNSLKSVRLLRLGDV